MAVPINSVDDGGGGHDHVQRVYQCRRCGWWWEEELEEIYLGGGDRISKQRCRFGVLRRYDPDSLDVPITALRQALSKNPDVVHSIHPRKCEELVGAVLKDHMHCEVQHVGRTGDGGIDLILVTRDEPFIVQVKRRADPRAVEGVAIIRELIGAMILAGSSNGIFVTTAKSFSKSARSAAKLAPVMTPNIRTLQLIDYPSFVRLMSLTLVKLGEPWQGAQWSDMLW